MKRLNQRPRRWQKDPLAALRLLNSARPYEEKELEPEHIRIKAAYVRLRDGGADEDDFDLVAHSLNASLVRAEQIDELLVETVKRGQDAMVRMKERYLRGMRFGLDAQGLQDMPPAIDAWEEIANNSSPLQIKYAMEEAFKRASEGNVLLWGSER